MDEDKREKKLKEIANKVADEMEKNKKDPALGTISMSIVSLVNVFAREIAGLEAKIERLQKEKE